MANPWEELANNLRAMGYSRPPQAAYNAAKASGVLEPGKTATFALPPGFKPGNARYLDEKEVSDSGIFLAKGLSPDDGSALYKKSFEDPNSYITEINPEAYFRKVYGDAWDAEVKPSALASQRRPDGVLSGIRAMRWINPDTTQEELGQTVHVIRTPGLGYMRTGVKYPSMGYLTPRGEWGRTIFVPREAHRVFGTGDHEMGHVLHTGIPMDVAAQPFLKTPNFTSDYNNRAVEMLANTAQAKRGHFASQGVPIRNQDQAELFLDNLLTSKVKPQDPDPIARYGGNTGKPVAGHSMNLFGLRRKLLDASPEERRKFVALLPKVFGVTGAVATGAAAATGLEGGDR